MIDNDHNGFVDCYDPACVNTTEMYQYRGCNDEIDNDGDGGIDCIDPDCNRSPLCDVEIGELLESTPMPERAQWSAQEILMAMVRRCLDRYPQSQ